MTDDGPTATGSLARLLDPGSIAIAGISADPGKHGARVVANLRRLGFPGALWGVNPRLPELEGVDIYQAMVDLPHPPDLVVAAVPADSVPDVVAGSSGVGGVIVFAAGFGEAGPSGKTAEHELAARAVAVGTRLLGPNSGGVIRPDRGLAASFLTCLDRPPGEIRTGPVAVVTQSGGTGSYLHNLAASRSEGIAVSISTGNEVDIKLGEAIDTVSLIEGVEVILVVAETVRDGVSFIDAVRSAHSRGKRVVVCPLGFGARSETLMASHTGALAIPQAVMSGVFGSLGVPVADTPGEAYEIASIVARATQPKGARAGVVTHSGGVAILASDLAERSGLTLPEPSPALSATVEKSLDHGSATNPLDMGGIMGGPGRFAEVVGQFADSGEYDFVLAVSTPHPPTHTRERVETLLALDTDTPIVHLWMAGDQGADGLSALRRAGAAVTEEPRAAIRALAALTRDLERPDRPLPITARPEQWGIPLNEGTVVSKVEEAVSAAEAIGYPVVVKLEASGVSHKTDVGGVFLDLRDSAAVGKAHRAVMAIAAERSWPDAGSRIQRYRPGLEMIVGALRHDSFGPLVSVGIGGVLAEMTRDVVFSPAPVDINTARDMIDRLQGRDLLDGYRGASPADLNGLARIVSLVSRGVAGSGISSFEINPLIWDGTDWVVADWLVE